MKKGISPLIATILIIGFTVALAAVIMTWGSSFIKGIQKETETKADIQITCIQKIDLNIRNICIFGNKVEMLIENKGSESINSFIFRVKGTEGKVSVGEGKGLGPAGISTFEAEFDPRLMAGIGVPTELAIFPRITSKDKSEVETCKETTVKIRPCEELPSLSNKKDWTFSMISKDVLLDVPLNIGPVEEGKEGFGDVIKVEDFINMIKQTKDAYNNNLLDIAATILDKTAGEVEDEWLKLTSPDVAFMMSNYADFYKITLESAPFIIPEKANNLCYSSAWVLNQGGEVNFKLKFADRECKISPVTSSDYTAPRSLYDNCKLLSGETIEESIESDCGYNPKGKKASFIMEMKGKNQYEFALLTRFCYATSHEASCIV